MSILNDGDDNVFTGIFIAEVIIIVAFFIQMSVR